MNILITGTYGFIGTNLSNTLREKRTLWTLDVTKQPSEAYSHYFSWKELEAIPWNNVNVVIHLAE
jgi:nucleoside-diphosphate-sugar epimerase